MKKTLKSALIIAVFLWLAFSSHILATHAQNYRDQHDRHEITIMLIRKANREIKAETITARVAAELAAETVADLQEIVIAPPDAYQLEKINILLQGLSGQLTGLQARAELIRIEADKIEVQTKKTGEY